MDDNAYVTRYDLSNPVTTGTGDAVRANAVPVNRVTDVAGAGVAAAITESVQTNVTQQLATMQANLTAQVAEIVTQVAALTTMVNNLAGNTTTVLQALADSNAAIAQALSSLTPATAAPAKTA